MPTPRSDEGRQAERAADGEREKSGTSQDRAAETARGGRNGHRGEPGDETHGRPEEEAPRREPRAPEPAPQASEPHLPASTRAPVQVVGTIRIEMVPPQPPATPEPPPAEPPAEEPLPQETLAEREPPADESATQEPMRPEPAPQEPAPLPEAAPAATSPAVPASPEEERAKPHGTSEQLLSYLEGLTRYLPEEQRSIYDGSDMHMRLEALKSRLRGAPGLHRESRRTRRTPPTGERITQSNIRDTFSFIGKLSQFHPDKDVGLALKYKIAHILGKLRKSP